LAEPHYGFDDAKDRLDRLLAQGVGRSALARLESVLHGSGDPKLKSLFPTEVIGIRRDHTGI
jgi:hypothetical protein